MHACDPQVDGLQRIYAAYLEGMIPLGDTQLQGQEGENVRAFRDALGLSEEQAAAVHVEVATKLYKNGFETKDRKKQYEYRKVSVCAKG